MDRTRDSQAGRDVAVKLPPLEVATNPGATPYRDELRGVINVDTSTV